MPKQSLNDVALCQSVFANIRYWLDRALNHWKEEPIGANRKLCAEQAMNAVTNAIVSDQSSEMPETGSFQDRVEPWMLQCFGPEIATDIDERNHRFIEEALELVQSCGATASECHQLVEYVFNRPAGEPHQESGGVMVTHAALCLANGLDMHENGEVELARIWGKVETIRAKQAAKPKHSPLPQAVDQKSGWQPIEMAPKDGRKIVAYGITTDGRQPFEVRRGCVYWSGLSNDDYKGRWLGGPFTSHCPAQFWQPFPNVTQISEIKDAEKS
jgi:hypothetical protein